METEKKHRGRRFLRAIGIAVLILGIWLWWRTGGIEVRVDEAALAAVPQAGDSIEFSVLTYNVQARPWFDETKEKFAGISPLLNRFDIVGLQELFKDHHRAWAQADHPVKVYHSRLKHSFKIVGSGLSNMGNFPLVETKAINFDALGEFQNKPASKGVLMTRFNILGMMVDVYNTHIEAGKSPEALQARIGQGDEIIAFVKENSPPEHSVIFVGDWNMRPSRGPEDLEENKDNPRVITFDRIVRELNFKDASDEVVGPTETDIDRILFRAGTDHNLDVLSWQKDDPDFYFENGDNLSDHDPVFSTFRLSRKGAEPDAEQDAEENADASN